MQRAARCSHEQAAPRQLRNKQNGLPAVHVDMYGQYSVVGSDGFDGLNDGGDSDFFGY
jgi:hypothetical protein